MYPLKQQPHFDNCPPNAMLTRTISGKRRMVNIVGLGMTVQRSIGNERHQTSLGYMRPVIRGAYTMLKYKERDPQGYYALTHPEVYDQEEMPDPATEAQLQALAEGGPA